MIRDVNPLRDKERVFRDRVHAGEVLAELLEAFRGTDALVLAVPAGGVPVAAEVARRLDLELDVVLVSKITLPWNTEAGFGAVAFDGTVRLNEALVASAGLSTEEVEYGVAKARAKVERRARLLRGDRPPPSIEARPVIVVDDGLASGFTLKVALEALRKLSPSEIHLAVPTAPYSSARELESEVRTLVCPNLRKGWSFAVASAYERWYDEDEEQVAGTLQNHARDRATRRPSRECPADPPAAPVHEG